MRLANPKEPSEITQVVNQFLKDTPVEHLPEFAKYSPKNWLLNLENLLKKAAQETGRPDIAGLHKWRKSTRKSLNKLNRLLSGDHDIEDQIKETEDLIDELLLTCEDILHKVNHKQQLQQYILQNISVETVWNRCSPYAKWPYLLADLETAVELIHENFALIQTTCISNTIAKYHKDNIDLIAKSARLLETIEILATEILAEADEFEAKELEEARKEFKKELSNQLVGTFISLSKQGKTKNFRTFELEHQDDFDLLKPEWKENGISLAEYRDMTTRAHKILKNKGITVTPITVDVSAYLRWLAATGRANTQQSREKYVLEQ